MRAIFLVGSLAVAAVVLAAGPAGAAEVDRVAGGHRVATAAQLTERTHPEGADVVVLARADEHADALAVGSLAAARDAPLLLTAPDGLHPDTAGQVAGAWLRPRWARSPAACRPAAWPERPGSPRPPSSPGGRSASTVVRLASRRGWPPARIGPTRSWQPRPRPARARRCCWRPPLRSTRLRPPGRRWATSARTVWSWSAGRRRSRRGWPRRSPARPRIPTSSPPASCSPCRSSPTPSPPSTTTDPRSSTTARSPRRSLRPPRTAPTTPTTSAGHLQRDRQHHPHQRHRRRRQRRVDHQHGGHLLRRADPHRGGLRVGDQASNFAPPDVPPNHYEAGKRPRSFTSPLIATDRGDDVELVVGSAGGRRIYGVLGQVLVHWHAHGRLSDAIAAARLHPEGSEVHVEEATSDEVVDALTDEGFTVERRGFGRYFGGVNAVEAHSRGLSVHLDPRRGGERR